MEEQAYALIPRGMGERLSACPLKMEDYVGLAQQLDTIIDSLR